MDSTDSSENTQRYRSPICSVLGHVDAGKTLFLDRLRNSKVQSGEPGGITQKIGVTYLNRDTLQNLVGDTRNGTTFAVPGIMFVDTPGHECFTAQRLTGVEISDLAIVVVDIFKGLEIQTIESLNLLRKSKTPCIIIANKVDRVRNWESEEGRNIRESYRSQHERTREYYDEYINNIIVNCAEQGLNAALYYKNKNHREFISIIPFSAKTGEGMPDLLMMISILCTKYLSKKIMITNEIDTGFLIERMVHPSYGSIITTVLTDGAIDHGDRLLFRDGYGDIIDTRVKRIFVPSEKTEVKDNFQLESIEKVDIPSSFVLNLDFGGQILPGTKFYSYHSNEEKEQYISILSKEDAQRTTREFSYSKRGVYLVAPTIGMMEALYNLCETREIGISGSKIGFISKTEVIRANPNIHPETSDEGIYNLRYSVILAYGIGPSKGILHEADRNNVRIITHDVIYKLLEEYKDYTNELDQEIRERNRNLHTPFEAQILPKYIFRTDNPIIMGVKVLEGTIHTGQVLMAVKDDTRMRIGTLISIQSNKDESSSAKKDAEACLKIDNTEFKRKYGKDFDDSYQIIPYYTQDEEYLVSNMPELFED